MKTIVVFGAGIAGLSAAHELSQLGYKVSVYEAMDQPGGFYRSARCSHSNMPSEYSWHGMGPWYHNTFDLMKQIPFLDRGSLYDVVLSRPIDFGIFPDDAEARFFDKGLKSIPDILRKPIIYLVRRSLTVVTKYHALSMNYTSSTNNEKEIPVVPNFRGVNWIS